MTDTLAFEFATAGRIVFGCGVAAKHLPGLLRDLQAHRPLLVTGSRSRYGALTAATEWAGVFEVHGEPTVDTAREGAACVQAVGADAVVAVGGGSVLDVAKVIAMLATNGGDPLDYMEVIGAGAAVRWPTLPLVAIPTTAGTGAEVTRNSVLASPQHGVKASVRSPHMLPAVALVDPLLTVTCPPAVTAATGLDAFTQCLEPFVSCMANPMTDALCREGLRRGARSLVAAFRDGSNIDARQDMALCSLLGGLALANAKLGAVHGFAGVLGGMFPTAPHGAVCAVLLPHVVAANVAALQQDPVSNSAMLAKYSEVAQQCGQATVDDFVHWVQAVGRELNVAPLSHYGVGPEHVEEVVGKAAASSSMKGNTLPLPKTTLAAIIRAAL